MINCSSCGRSFLDEELAGCYTCDARFCLDCDWECECDRKSLEIVERAEEMRAKRIRQALAA
jgi:hypothetical protein